MYFAYSFLSLSICAVLSEKQRPLPAKTACLDFMRRL